MFQRFARAPTVQKRSFSAAMRHRPLASTSTLSKLSSGSTFAQSRSIIYQAPQKDLNFVLNDVLKAPEVYEKLGFEGTTSDVIESVVGECSRFCENVLLPLYEVGDKEGCKLNADGTVTTPTGFKEAYAEYAQGGWQSLAVPEEYGGQGMPLSLGLVKAELIAGANWSWGMYPGLSIGAMNTLAMHASEEIKQKYLTKLASGEWLGTMCLTEPQCGSDLGQVKTKAVPDGNGAYKITGTKIFISCGDHDFTENVIHIVLARLPDAPEGTKGISLFLVPRHLDDGNGGLQKDLNVRCTRLENKMGIHGSATSEMTFDETTGYLLGEPNTGLFQMFTFMNTARLGTAMQGLATIETAYQNATAYAKDRTSMRSLSGVKSPNKVADEIIHHPDIRRMLLGMRAILEPGRVMMYEASLIADKWLKAETKEEARKVDNELGLLTPILKGFLTEIGNLSADHGMQVWGGHGYIRESGMEQIYRDSRISSIYEGTTGIQALDLLGRKVLQSKGALLNKYAGQMTSFAYANMFKHPELRSHFVDLTMYVWRWRFTTLKLMMTAKNKGIDRDIVGTASYDYLMYSGYVCMAYYWLRMSVVAKQKMSSAEHEEDKQFYKDKLALCDYYFSRVLPKAKGHLATMTQHPKDTMKFNTDFF